MSVYIFLTSSYMCSESYESAAAFKETTRTKKLTQVPHPQYKKQMFTLFHY